MRLPFTCVLLSGCLGSYAADPTHQPASQSSGADMSMAPSSTSPSSPPSGDPSSPPAPSLPPGTPTFYHDALPVFQRSCLGCHATDGATAPVLDQASAAQAAAAMILAAVQSGIMPPFPPAPNCNHYVDERRISDVDQQTLLLWVNAGAPAGNPADAPPPLPPPPPPGTPDTHATTGPFTPTYPGSAGPDDLYWCYIVDPKLTAARDLVKLNVVPGVKAEVHHVIVFRDADGQGSAGKPASGYECNGVPGAMLAGWVPGAGPLELPSGVGMTLSPGDKLLMQVHYHRDPSVTPSPDSTSLDLYYSASPTPEHAFVVWTGTPLFTIPANAKGYQVKSTCTATGAWKVLGIAPHMHTHGTAFTSFLDGNQCVMNIPHWDFGWQGGYFLQTPIDLKQGDTIATTCTYDNPTASSIGFGEATTDEMCFGFLYVVAAAQPTFTGIVNLVGGSDTASMCAQ
jgi:hypothetical protein